MKWMDKKVISTKLYKLRLPFALLIFAVLLCSGCELTNDPQSYMRLPQLPEDRASLKQVIQNALPPGAALVQPKNSRAAGSIFLHDLNGDGLTEAIVYYQTSENNKRLTGMLWQQAGTTWKLLSEFQGEGYELDTLLFDEVTQSGSIDVIAGYSGGAKVAKGLIVYRFDGQSLDKVLEAPYTQFIVDDLNQDHIKDLSILTLERNVSSTLNVLQYSQNSFKTIGTTPLDYYVNGYFSITAGWIAESIRGIVLDAGVGAHSAYSQLLYFEQDRLTKGFPDDAIPIKPRPSVNGDFNRDGILEIGIDHEPAGWEQKAYANMPWITAFYRWDAQLGLSPEPLYEWFMDIGSGFYFEIPAGWKNFYKFQRTENDEGLRIVFDVSDGSETVEWKTVSAEDWALIQPSAEWLEIGRTSKTVTALHLTESGRKYTEHFHSLTDLEK